MQANDLPRRLGFGVFEVDLRDRELTKRGVRIRLQEQPFQVLAMLLERAGEVVTRDELRSRLWPDKVVEFDHGLTKAISKIREVLGDSVERPRFVETVARRGYRFLADVAVIDIPDRRREPTPHALARPSDTAPADRTDAAASLKQAVRPYIWSLVFGLALVLTVSLSWILYFKNQSLPQIRSLAVLPMENLSGDASQDYLSDGMTDQLIASLGQISALRVISRTSVMTYKGVRKPLTQIAGELNVDAVVEGSVLRSGDQVRITAQLIQASTDKHIWAQSYEGEIRDTLVLQNRVAHEIAEQIHVTLNRQEQAALGSSRTVNPEAYEAYLTGRYYWNKRTGDGLKRAIDHFNRAVDKDPNYAQAYTGLADSYALSGDWEYGLLSPDDAFPKAKAAVTRSLVLDDNLAEVHTSLAFILDLYDWNWELAEHEYKRAIALNPSYATAHQWYAWHLIVMGRNGEAIAESRKAEGLDPLSPIISADLADALCVAHLYDESVQQSRKTLEMHPHFAVAHYQLGQALAQKGMHNKAIASLQRAIELSRGNMAFESNLAYVYAISGRPDEAIKIIKNLEDRPSRPASTDAHIALVYVGLGDRDQAMSWLNKAYAAHFNPSILMRPAFDPLRSDVRFQDLLRRIGLPQAGPTGSLSHP
jgi:TolB-like protein/DNA-binding winged helix-turn-helix (wHTH) protein/Flp pilus assembly protein TadD